MIKIISNDPMLSYHFAYLYLSIYIPKLLVESYNPLYSIMKNYQSPVCFSTNQKATVFCTNYNCNQSVFGCEEECMSSRHQQHQTYSWSLIEGQFRQVMERSLSESEKDRLERQQKQVKIIKEELKVLSSEHINTVIKLKQRLQEKGAVKTVATAIRNRTTETLTGKDMVHLLIALNNEDFFANSQTVHTAIQQWNSSFEVFLSKLITLITEFKQQIADLTVPEQIVNDDFTTIHPTIHIAHNQMAVVNPNFVTVKSEDSKWYSIFADESLNDGQSFDVKVFDTGSLRFTVGVATAELRNRSNQKQHTNSICLKAYGVLYCNGSQQELQLDVKTGDKLTIRRRGSAERIEWIKDGELVCFADIPKRLRYQHIFPVVWIYSEATTGQTSKLQFL